jgi:hypothetical protein
MLYFVFQFNTSFIGHCHIITTKYARVLQREKNKVIRTISCSSLQPEWQTQLVSG